MMQMHQPLAATETIRHTCRSVLSHFFDAVPASDSTFAAGISSRPEPPGAHHLEHDVDRDVGAQLGLLDLG